ncbi:hypothetical protein BVRB_6g138070 [Beta vulgaris subsp. vulgaris]|nr:hypothetical protein BVRB_6g138070 [Beta vulgaris subsp. vulgaris]
MAASNKLYTIQLSLVIFFVTILVFTPFDVEARRLLGTNGVLDKPGDGNYSAPLNLDKKLDKGCPPPIFRCGNSLSYCLQLPIFGSVIVVMP